MRSVFAAVLAIVLMALAGVSPPVAHAEQPWTPATSPVTMPNLCVANLLTSAPNWTWAGSSGSASGRIVSPRAGVTAFLEVGYGAGWARIATTTTDATGAFTLPLSYGVSTVGRYHFRLGAIIDGRVVHSRDWWTYRLPVTTVTLQSANASAPVGSPQTARGRVTPYPAANVGYVEVWTGGTWTRIGSGTVMPGTREFLVDLSYGQNTRGTYRFRLRADVAPQGVSVYSRTWTLTRT